MGGAGQEKVVSKQEAIKWDLLCIFSKHFAVDIPFTQHYMCNAHQQHVKAPVRSWSHTALFNQPFMVKLVPYEGIQLANIVLLHGALLQDCLLTGKGR